MNGRDKNLERVKVREQEKWARSYPPASLAGSARPLISLLLIFSVQRMELTMYACGMRCTRGGCSRSEERGIQPCVNKYKNNALESINIYSWIQVIFVIFYERPWFTCKSNTRIERKRTEKISDAMLVIFH